MSRSSRKTPGAARLLPGRSGASALLLLLLAALGGGASAAPSSYSKGESGARVLYLLLEDLGYRPMRIFDLAEIEEKADRAGEVELLVVLGATDKRLGARALRWARRGGSILLAPPFLSEDGVCGKVDFGSLSVERRFALVPLQPGAAGARDGGPGPARAPKGPPSHGSDLALSRSPCLLVPPKDRAAGSVLAATPDGAVALEREVAGGGSVLVVANDLLLVNAVLDRDDIAVLLRRWLERSVPSGATVAFYEERVGGDLVKTLRAAGLAVFAVHALLVLLLLYFRLAPRSGDPPAARPPSTRRAFSQHARALGHLYQRRGASRYALARQYERFVSRVARGSEGSAGPAAPPARRRADLVPLVASLTGRDRDFVEALLAQVESALVPRGPEEAASDHPERLRFRLGQSLASLQRSARQKHRGGNRGRKELR